SEASVAPGERFTLVLHVRPRPGMHVYAPGAAGYRVIELTVAPQSFIRTADIRYPLSETYFFQPLRERVPVYQKPFTLLQDVVVEATADAQAGLKGIERLTLTGTLNYQACDDKMCFNPVAVPLSWSIGLRELIR